MAMVSIEEVGKVDVIKVIGILETSALFPQEKILKTEKKKIIIRRILTFKRINSDKIISIFDNSFIFNFFIQFIACSFE